MLQITARLIQSSGGSPWTVEIHDLHTAKNEDGSTESICLRFICLLLKQTASDQFQYSTVDNWKELREPIIIEDFFLKTRSHVSFFMNRFASSALLNTTVASGFISRCSISFCTTE
jgi:hypothetical protein